MGHRRNTRSRRTRHRPSFLLVSKDENTISVVKERLSRNKCNVLVLDDLQAIERSFKSMHLDVALLDMSCKIAGYSAFDLFRLVKNLNKDTRICFLTNFSIDRKEFLNVFPSIPLDFVINKKEMTSSELYDMFRMTVH
nr:hypothetical protein Josef01_02j05_47 [uncultured archaeon]